jgi:hypothetical protein
VPTLKKAGATKQKQASAAATKRALKIQAATILTPLLNRSATVADPSIASLHRASFRRVNTTLNAAVG